MNQPLPELKAIHLGFQDAINKQPAYKEMLLFFKNFFEMQEAAVAHTYPDEIKINPNNLIKRLEDKTPMLDRKRVSVDIASALRLLPALCTAAETANAKLAQAAEALKAVLEQNIELIRHGIKQFMTNNSAVLQKIGQELSVEPELIAFFIYHSIWPSLAHHSRGFSAHHDLNGHWQRGYCPVCGSMPMLSFLSESGQRHLVCSFCRHQWSIPRILCPHCLNDDAESIEYFYNEDDRAYRVYTCNLCRRYIKTIDTRQLSRHFYPPLESLMTVHLDIQAQNEGFLSIAPDELSI